MSRLEDIFSEKLPVIGMIHLDPLPGTPKYQKSSINEIAEKALEEAKILDKCGVDGVIVENFNDMMFQKQVGPEVVAPMTYVAEKIKSSTNLSLGLCVLQSDPFASLSIAKTVGGDFIRVPYYTETYIVDAGVMESVAADTLRFRKKIDAENIGIFADVHIKHGYTLSRRPLAESAEDAVERGLADAVIITGRKTGGKTDPEDVYKVNDRLSETPVIVGSGVTSQNLEKYFPKEGDAAIVGTSLKKDGKVENMIDEARVERFMEKVRKCRKEVR